MTTLTTNGTSMLGSVGGRVAARPLAQPGLRPGRALRRPVYINPRLAGPDDQPIIHATTVRVLGGARPIPS
jgi:hypothetical protein